MKKIDNLRKLTLTRYTNRYKKYQYDPRSLGWGSLRDQEQRFVQILRFLPKKVDKLIDIGCGFGDFYDFMKNSKVNCKEYIGWDINNNFIKLGKKKYNKKKNVKFFLQDILKYKKTKPIASYGVIIGLLNYNWHNKYDNLKLTKLTISKAFSLVDKCLIVDFLSIYRNKNYPLENQVFYHDPSQILKFCLTLSKNVQLIHDYKPIPQKEFMISIKKD